MAAIEFDAERGDVGGQKIVTGNFSPEKDAMNLGWD
jgi:hypothetical protein